MTKDEFTQMQKSVVRREKRRLLVILIISFVVIALTAGFTNAVLTNPAVEDFFLSLVTRHRHWIPAGFGMLTLGMFLSVARIARGPSGLKCPTCNRPISCTITLLTSNCGHCGERIIT